MSQVQEVNAALIKMDADVGALIDALKPFAEFWANRMPLSSEPGDEMGYVWARSRHRGGEVTLRFGDFRRALKVYADALRTE